MKDTDRTSQDTRICALLALVTPLLLYLNSITCTFVYDDSELIVSKLAPETFADWLHTALSPYYPGLPYYRPLPGLLFALERALFGLEPWGYHLINVLIVGALGLALYKLLRLPIFSLTPVNACALSIICTSHPATSSVVYMLSGCEALLSVLLLTITALQLLRNGFGLGAALALFLALLCRESAVFFLPLAVFLVLRRPQGLDTRQAISDCIRLSTVIIFYLLLRHTALETSTGAPRLSDDWRLIPLSYLYALSSILTPTLTLHYEPELSEWLIGSRMALLAIALVLMNFLLRQSHALKRPVACATACLSLVSFLPTANVFEQETPFDERHLIAPLILLVITLGISLQQLLKNSVKFPLFHRFWYIPIVTALLPISFLRVTAFKTDDTFFASWISNSPARSKIINHIAARALAEGDISLAYELANRSVTLRGNSPGFLYRGRAEREMSDLPAARADFNSAIELDPALYVAYCDLGLVDLLEHQPEAARKRFEEAGRKDRTIWCGPDNHRLWQDSISERGKQLTRFPISTREELRNYDQGRILLAAPVN